MRVCACRCLPPSGYLPRLPSLAAIVRRASLRATCTRASHRGTHAAPLVECRPHAHALSSTYRAVAAWTGAVDMTRHAGALLEVLAVPVPVLVAVLVVLAVSAAVLAVLEMLAAVLVVVVAVTAAVLETLVVLAAVLGIAGGAVCAGGAGGSACAARAVSLRCAACAGRLASELAGVQRWCWTRGRGAGAGRLPCQRHALGVPASRWQAPTDAQHRRHRLGSPAGAHSRPPHHARNAHTARVLLRMPRRASSALALDGLVAHAAHS